MSEVLINVIYSLDEWSAKKLMYSLDEWSANKFNLLIR